MLFTERFFKIFLCTFFTQNCFVCRRSDSSVSEDAGIEPKTVATSALAVRRSNYISSTLGHISTTIRLHLIHTWLHPIHNLATSHSHSATTHPQLGYISSTLGYILSTLATSQPPSATPHPHSATSHALSIFNRCLRQRENPFGIDEGGGAQLTSDEESTEKKMKNL